MSFEEVPEGVHTIPVRPFSRPRSLQVLDFARRASLLRSGFDVVHGLGKIWAVDVYHPHTGSHRASLEALDRSREGSPWRGPARWMRALSPRQAAFRWIEEKQYSAHGAARFIAVSEMVAEQLRRFHGVDSERIDILRNPVDGERFRPAVEDRAPFRARFGIGEDEVVCLFMANHFRLKGLAPLIRALARLGSGSPLLLVLGRGNPRPFARMAEDLGVRSRVLFGGETAEPEQAYRACDFFVLPTFYDPCSLTVLEAMASECPVITSRSNGASELIEPGRDGLLLDDPARDDLLADQLSRLSRPEQARDLGRRAREKALSLGFESHLEKILRLYEEVARGRKSRSPRGKGPGRGVYS